MILRAAIVVAPLALSALVALPARADVLEIGAGLSLRRAGMQRRGQPSEQGAECGQTGFAEKHHASAAPDAAGT